jgi:DUF971 family protein
MNVPERVEIDMKRRRLTLVWNDADVQLFDTTTLRARCPCSTCRRLLLAGTVATADEEIAIVDVRSMGYGVQFVFSDGHDQGVYPWTYLSAMR